MEKKIVGLGVVGCGAIAIRAAFEHFKLGDVDDKIRIVACCDPVPGRAKAAAEKYNIPRYYESYEELLEDSNVDAVTLCSPIGFHYEQGMQALRAGKHVHFNKTMATEVWEADDLINLAKEKKLHIVASPGQMLYPEAQRTRRAILEGRLGKIAYIFGKHSFSSGVYHLNEKCRTGDDILANINPTWYFKKPGGGPHYDVTVYFLHQLTGVMGPAKRVAAFSGQQIHELSFGGKTFKSEVDDSCAMLIDFGDGVYCTMLSVIAGAPFVCLTPDYFGTKGSIVAEKLDGKSLIYEGESLPGITGEHDNMPEKHVFADILQLADCIRENKDSIVSPEHARNVIEIIAASFESSKTNTIIELKTSFDPIPYEDLLEFKD